MARWTFFTNHLRVLTALAGRPDLRLREVATEVGITERAAHRIIGELVEEGYLTRTRVGSRNRYEVHPDAALGHPAGGPQTDRVIRLLTDKADSSRSNEMVAQGIEGSGEGDIFGEVFRSAPAGMVVGDERGRLVAVNRAFCAIVGRREDELVGHDFREFTHPDDLAGDEQGWAGLASGDRSEYVTEKRYLRRDGSPAWVKVRAAVADDPRTGRRVFIAHIVDIGERKRHELALAEAEERFRSAFDNAPIGIALVAPDGRFIKVNRSLCELTGFSETALLVRSFQSITHPNDLDADLAHVQDVLAGRRRTYQMEKRYFHADGHVIWVMLSVSLVRDAAGQPLYFISQIADITERKWREEELQDRAEQLAVIASTDPLTGLSTRRAWDVAINERMRRRGDRAGSFAVALIDLDGLKEINDTHGHGAGDDALAATASALRAALRDGDLVARLGGDEFAILVPDADLDATLALTERILEALPKPLTASAGVAVWDGRESAARLQRRADKAMYAAKREGKGHARLASAEQPAGERNPRLAAGIAAS
ncbi:MAG TPA: PAS domain S-box protein [Solirubrobacteraceae bacterium]|nr:PAS domain S-box protein [Solirubrobacteraceae bacterium]